MKQRKRFIAYILTIALLAGFYSIPANIAYAEELLTSDGCFTYAVNNNQVTITGYCGPKGKPITIPAAIDGKTVVGIGYCNNSSDNVQGVFQGNYEFDTIYLPDTLEIIGDSTFRQCGLAHIYIYASTGTITGNVSGNASADASGNASADASADASGNASADASADASGNASADASADASGNASADASADASGNASADASADASGNASGDASADASADASGNASGDASADASGNASGDADQLLYTDRANPLPSHLSRIGAKAFNNTRLTEINFNDSITYIGDNAFMDTPLTSFTLPETSHLTYIGEGVIRSNIKEVILKGEVDTIADGAFSNISTLESFTANRVGIIGDNAFQNSTLKTFTITGGLSAIKKETFKGCGSLETVIIHSDTPYSIEPYAFTCSSIKTIKLSDGITTIEEGTFSNCGKLDTVVLPDSLANIEKDAFQNVSSITNINIAEDVTVDKNAFEGAGGSTLGALSQSNNQTIKDIVAAGGSTTETATAPPTTAAAATTQTPPKETPKAPKIKKVKLKSAKKNKSRTKVTLKWKKTSGISGYTIYVKAVAKGKKASKVSWKKVTNVTAKKTSYKVKLTSKQKKILKKKGTLYFSIKAYKKANGKTYYGSYSNTKKVKR